MPMDFETCYRAFSTRDRRFDGRFVTAVVTTGIYCRPGCPARTPARGNVRFYSCAAAAESAGFRACLRCRPEAVPGSATWLGTSATVSRALRLIEEGALDDEGVESLASRLGVTGRWLRRLFEDQLGASPLAVDLTRRVHFARRLLETTALGMDDIALASGFGSARRLHAAVRKSFARAPRDLRGAPGGTDTGLELKLPVRAPHDLSAVFEFLGSRAIAGIESAAGGVYRRSFCLAGASGVLEARHAPGERWLTLRVPELPPRRLPQLVARVSRVFDLAADPGAIAAHLRRDRRLRGVLPAHGVRVPGAWDAFEIGVRALLGQQVSVAAARTLAGRLVRAFGAPLAAGNAQGDEPDGAAGDAPAPNGNGHALAAITHGFPSPEAIADADLDGLGLTRARAAALRSFAAAVADGSLALEANAGLDDAVLRLTALPGIGDWTAQYIAMRGLGEPDAFPAGDLGVRQALAANGRIPTEREALAAAESWRPWRAYAVIALWTQPSSTRSRKESS